MNNERTYETCRRPDRTEAGSYKVRLYCDSSLESVQLERDLTDRGYEVKVKFNGAMNPTLRHFGGFTEGTGNIRNLFLG